LASLKRIIRVDFGMSATCPVTGGNLGNAGCPVLPVEGIGLDVIQAPKRGLESCGMNSRTLNGLPSGRFCRTSRVAFAVFDDRRVLNGIFWVLRSGRSLDSRRVPALR
jgi:hypothetical protein